jgi:hypothetical protein
MNALVGGLVKSKSDKNMNRQIKTTKDPAFISHWDGEDGV